MRVPQSLSGLRNVLQWSIAERCVLAAVCAIVFTTWGVVILGYLVAHPSAAPYIDHDFVRTRLLPTLIAMIAVWLAVIGAALAVRHDERRSRAIMYAVAALYGLFYGFVSYVLGSFTMLFTGSVLFAALAFCLLLLAKSAAALALGTFVGMVVVSAALEQAGAIPYAPFLREAPFRDGHLATSWLLGIGGFDVMLLLFVAALIYFIVDRWQDREEVLRTRTAKLVRTAAALEASHGKLRQAYQDLESTQTQLVQSEKMASLGQLVAGVAHELNNPVSFVHGGLANLAEYLSAFVELVAAYEEATPSDGGAQARVAAVRKRVGVDYLLRETPRLLRICEEGSERIKRIVEDLRLFARADGGERAAVDLREGMESTLRLLSPRLRRDAVEVRRAYEDGVPAIEGDEGQLSRVWMNLVSNALDAVEGRQGSEITVRVRRGSGDRVEVEVEDNGAGMEASVAGRIFEPFFTTKPVGRGTGLGLSIAYGAVQTHAGTIAVASDLGRGTRFVVSLPVKSTPAR